MKIGVIIPDRGDRPEFMANCLRMIESQTMQPTDINHVKHSPVFNTCDITQRYRIGYHYFDGQEFDCILLMENDDYYAPDYIETMVKEWEKHGRPDIFGTAYTIYYHIGMKSWHRMDHARRSSAMNTLIKPDLNIKWPVDHEPYTDIHLWQQLKANSRTFTPENHISIGIKHGVGLTGGQYHTTKLDRSTESDAYFYTLQSWLDEESFNFYKSVHEKIQSSFTGLG